MVAETVEESAVTLPLVARTFTESVVALLVMSRCLSVVPSSQNTPLLEILTSESVGVSVTEDAEPETSVLSDSHFLYFVCEPDAEIEA